MTLLLRKKGVPRKREGAYVQCQGRLFQVPMERSRLDQWKKFVRDEEARRVACEVFLLRMKANGKELDPKWFNEEEAESFRRSDQAEWQSWIDNGVVEPVAAEEAHKIPKDCVFKIPLRYVRVNKNKEMNALSKVMAKSRLVVPGHADPHLGDYRTDAPTVNPVAVRLLKTLAVTRKWTVMIFDVSTAFLSGNPTSRKVYVRAPMEGLPSTKNTPAIPPFVEGVEISIRSIRSSPSMVSPCCSVDGRIRAIRTEFFKSYVCEDGEGSDRGCLYFARG